MRYVHDVLYNNHGTVNWSDSADVALGRMDKLRRDELAVVDASGVIGLCQRDMLLAHQERGAWLGSVAVIDLMRRGPFGCHEDDGYDRVGLIMDRLKTNTLAVLDKNDRVIGTIHRKQSKDEPATAGARPLERALS